MTISLILRSSVLCRDFKCSAKQGGITTALCEIAQPVFFTHSATKIRTVDSPSKE